MIRQSLLVAAVGLSMTILTTTASAQPFPSGVVAKGQGLHAAKCVSCHNSMMPDGKGEELYSEFARKMTNAAGLKGMVEFCANRTKSGWFEEEIVHVSRYLNDTYYKFPK